MARRRLQFHMQEFVILVVAGQSGMEEASEPLPPSRPSFKWRLPLFGHRRVSLSRHAAAVPGTAFLVGAAVALVAVALAAGEIVLEDASPPRDLAGYLTTLAVGTWAGGFFAVLVTGGLFFTFGWLALSGLKQNFGAAYLGIGLLGGVLSSGIGAKESVTPLALASFAIFGLVAGLCYWVLVAGRSDSPTSD